MKIKTIFKRKSWLKPTLDKVLKDKRSSAAFRLFLQSEYSEENIEFWLACKDYREATSPTELSGKAQEIYQEFLCPEAHREVNIDHCIQNKIKRSMAEPGPSCFDEAEKHVYRLMERDSCPRFLRSEAYLRLRHKVRRTLVPW